MAEPVALIPIFGTRTHTSRRGFTRYQSRRRLRVRSYDAISR